MRFHDRDKSGENQTGNKGLGVATWGARKRFSDIFIRRYARRTSSVESTEQGSSSSTKRGKALLSNPVSRSIDFPSSRVAARAGSRARTRARFSIYKALIRIAELPGEQETTGGGGRGERSGAWHARLQKLVRRCRIRWRDTHGENFYSKNFYNKNFFSTN